MAATVTCRTIPFPQTPSRDERCAWSLWLACFLFIAGSILAGHNRSVLVYYTGAAECWLQRASLYDESAHGFLYLPQAAVLFVPFCKLPPVVAEIAWRAFSIGILACGFRRFCRLAESRDGARVFLLGSCVAIAVSFSAVRNGQATIIITGLMLLALHELTHANWNRATALLCLGLAFKPLTLVLVLLVAATHRPMLWRLALGTGLLLLAPYVISDSTYVTTQYAAFVRVMRTSAQVSLNEPWAQVFWMFRTAGIVVAAEWQLLVRLVAAGATLLAAWTACRRLPSQRAAFYLFALAGCYLMLFNPRTENNTYALVAPALGLFCAEAFLVQRKPVLGVFAILIALGTVGSFEIGSRLVPSARPVWLAPLMCLGFSAALLRRMFHEMRHHQVAFLVASTAPRPASQPRRRAA